MVVLLQHPDSEVVFTVCGVLMNLMGDDVGRWRTAAGPIRCAELHTALSAVSTKLTFTHAHVFGWLPHRIGLLITA
jgi:hypothetical protein